MKIKDWNYQLTLYTNRCKVVCLEDNGTWIEEKVKTLLKESGVDLWALEITATSIEVQIVGVSQDGIKKFAKILSQKLEKDLLKKVPELRAVLPLWDKNICILTRGNHLSAIERFNKVLENLEEVAYYDLDEAFTEEIPEFVDFMKQREVDLIEYGDRLFFVDRQGVQAKINLNCFGCTKRYQYGCCCGSPCDLSEKNKQQLSTHLPNMMEQMQQLDPTYYEEMAQKGGVIDETGKINGYQGRCALLIEEEGIYKCMVHKYAAEVGISIYEICSLSCLMYPLEILELIVPKKKQIFLLTSVVEEKIAKEFGRWGSYEALEVKLECIHEAAHDEVFRKEAYQTVYQVNEQLITHELGECVYKSLKTLMN